MYNFFKNKKREVFEKNTKHEIIEKTRVVIFKMKKEKRAKQDIHSEFLKKNYFFKN
jgi:hypothetical protein